MDNVFVAFFVGMAVGFILTPVIKVLISNLTKSAKD